MCADETHSLLIAGAGPVGLATAALLMAGPAATKIRLRLIESREPTPWQPTQIGLRVYALSRSSQDVLETAGVWQSIADRRVSPYERMCVWQGSIPDGPGSLTFDCADIGEPDLGHIVEDSLIRDALAERVASAPNAECTYGVSIGAIEHHQDRLDVAISNGERTGVSLLIAADGSSSAVRDAFDMPAVTRDYRQQALVTHIETERAHARTAYQRFLPGGPLAFLPLADGRSSVVWSLPSDDARRLSEIADNELGWELHKASGGVLGDVFDVAERGLFRLEARHVMRYSARRVVLVGDAAHAVHPLAGQGMNLGLLDAAALAAVIEQAILKGENPGDERILKRYERLRKGDNLRMVLALDAVDRIFRLPGFFAPLGAAGLQAADRITPLKRRMMRHALGLSRRARAARPG